MISIGNFIKRVNSDATIDMVCTHCFQTAATGTSDAEVTEMAQQHACIVSLFAPLEESEEYANSQRGTF